MRCVANLLTIGAVAALVGSPVSAACWEPDEYAAARMRDLQTVLMVSALKCGRAQPAMPAAYNRWVGRAKASLLEGEQKLLGHFVREGDKAKYDKFTTALANRYSEYSEDPKFCARAEALLEADDKQPGVLAEVALLINSKPNGVEEFCPAKKPPASQIIVSPFDPIPDAARPADAPVVASAAPAAAAANLTPAAAAANPVLPADASSGPEQAPAIPAAIASPLPQ
ncbi:MAG: hypothetical protein ACRC1J_12475 [Sandaracinobacteroides sp.]